MDAPPGSGETAAPLGHRLQRSFGWAVLSQVLQRGGGWLSMLVLARLLALEDLGTYSIAFAVVFFLLAFNDLGLAAAVARHRGDNLEALAATGATVALAFSTFLYGVLFLAAPTIVGVFAPSPGSPAVGVVRLAGLVVIVDAVAAAAGASLSRVLDERRRGGAELGGFVVAIATNVGLAWAGAGAWSLAGGQVAGALTTAALLQLVAPVRLRFAWNRAEAVGLVRFGLPLVGVGVCNQAILNSDYLLVNRYLSTATAGAYFIAFNVSNWPATLISFAMRRTALSGFSMLRDDPPALSRAFRKAFLAVIGGTVPVALLIVVHAADLLDALFPARYAVAATALAFLGSISVFRLVFSLCVDLFTSLGRTYLVLPVQIAWLVALNVAMRWAVTRHGMAGIGVSQLAAAALVAAPLLGWRLRAAGVHLDRLGRPLTRVALGGLALAAATSFTRRVIEPTWLRLVVGGTAGGSLYLAVAVPFPQLASTFGRAATALLHRYGRASARRAPSP